MYKIICYLFFFWMALKNQVKLSKFVQLKSSAKIFCRSQALFWPENWKIREKWGRLVQLLYRVLFLPMLWTLQEVIKKEWKKKRSVTTNLVILCIHFNQNFVCLRGKDYDRLLFLIVIWDLETTSSLLLNRNLVYLCEKNYDWLLPFTII